MIRKRKINNSKRRRLIIDKLKEKYGLRCWYCGKSLKDEMICLDHIVPFSRGGEDGIDNFALSCKFCNTHKFNFSVEEFLKYLAYIRTGAFYVPCLEDHHRKLTPHETDILQKSFYDVPFEKDYSFDCPNCHCIVEDYRKHLR